MSGPNHPAPRAHVLLVPRVAALLAATAAVTLGVVVVTGGPAALLLRATGSGGLGALPFADVLTGLCALALAGAWLWCVLTGAAVAVGALASAVGAPGAPAASAARAGTAPEPAPVRRRVAAPRLVRVAVLAGLGLPLAGAAWPAQAAQAALLTAAAPTAVGDGGATQGAVAAAGDGGRRPAVRRPGTGVLTGLPLPDRVAAAPSAVAPGRAHPASTPPPGRGTQAVPTPPHVVRQVVVRPGDCLWSLAAREVAAPGAAPAAVAAAVQRLRDLNDRALGPDPDLIFPGTRLVLPSPAAPSGKERQ